MIRLTTRYVLPLLVGTAWVWVAIRWHWQFQSDAIDLHRTVGGTNTLKAFTFNPPLIVWWLTRVPEGRWHVAPLYAYYASLTLLLWNAPRNVRCWYAATLVYLTHLMTNLVAILVAGTLGLPRELVGSFDLTADLILLMKLTESFPGTVYTTAVILLIWHALATTCLYLGWKQSVSIPEYATDSNLA